MRIGIDCRTILDPKSGEAAGVGHYTYHLVRNLIRLDQKNEYILFFDPKIGDFDKFREPNVEIKFFPFIKYKRYLPFVYSHLFITAFISKSNLDIFHSPASTLPLSYRGVSVVTIHDMAIYINKDWFPDGQKFSTDYAVPKSVENASKVIAVSESTKDDIVKYLQTDPKKIEVVYNGIDQRKEVDSSILENLKKKNGIRDKYLLIVGTVEPRKNIIGAIKAYNKLDRLNDEYQLVIAGKAGWKSEDIYECRDKFNLKDKVKFVGYVSNDEKTALLQGAELFIFPSFYEGFGMPVLEAMQQGVPVITSNISSLPEVAGGAAVLVNPNNEIEIEKSIEELLNNSGMRDELICKGFKQVKKFSWENCAKNTINIYKGLKKI